MKYALTVFLILHGADGSEFTLITSQVITRHASVPGHPLRNGINCLIYTSGDYFVSVKESCETVAKKVRGVEK